MTHQTSKETASASQNRAEHRETRVIRELPVRELTEDECRRLLVHAHDVSRERRDAYLYKRAGDHPEIYFKPAQIAAIKVWIKSEGLPTTKDAARGAVHTPGWYVVDRANGNRIFNGPYRQIETASAIRDQREMRQPEGTNWNLSVTWLGDTSILVEKATYDAAPELLDALKFAEEYLSSPPFIALHGKMASTKARAAIARAEGRQP